MELEVDCLISEVHLSLCNSILDFGTCFLQIEHETIEVLLDFFIVSFLLCLDFRTTLPFSSSITTEKFILYFPLF